MTTRNDDQRQTAAPKREPGEPPRKLLSVRLALIIALSLCTSLAGAFLLYLAHQPGALIVFASAGVLVGAVKFYDWLIGE
jgi:hypothetical protein